MSPGGLGAWRAGKSAIRGHLVESYRLGRRATAGESVGPRLRLSQVSALDSVLSILQHRMDQRSAVGAPGA